MHRDDFRDGDSCVVGCQRGVDLVVGSEQDCITCSECCATFIEPGLVNVAAINGHCADGAGVAYVLQRILCEQDEVGAVTGFDLAESCVLVDISLDELPGVPAANGQCIEIGDAGLDEFCKLSMNRFAGKQSR